MAQAFLPMSSGTVLSQGRIYNIQPPRNMWPALVECAHCETKLSDDLKAMRAVYCSADCARAAEVAERITGPKPAETIGYSYAGTSMVLSGTSMGLSLPISSYTAWASTQYP